MWEVEISKFAFQREQNHFHFITQIDDEQLVQYIALHLPVIHHF